VAILEQAFTPLLLSLKVAGVATALVLAIATPIAFGVARHRFPGSDLLDSAFSLPLVLPPTVLGYYLLVLVGRRGWIGAWLEENLGLTLVFTWQGAALASAVVAFPLLYRSARTAFEEVSPQLEGAARTLGASACETFVRVTFPLAWRGILGGSMLAFARSMGEFGATLMVAGSLPGRTQTLSLAVYDAVQAGRDGLAHALVAIASLSCMVILYLAGKLLEPRLG
jgi:molybdate transport system permease protein